MQLCCSSSPQGENEHGGQIIALVDTTSLVVKVDTLAISSQEIVKVSENYLTAKHFKMKGSQDFLTLVLHHALSRFVWMMELMRKKKFILSSILNLYLVMLRFN